MIYLLLKGRIGNQLFMYAMAKAVQRNGEKIVIDDAEVLKMEWENSLPNYALPDVEYTHSHKTMARYGFVMQGIYLKFYHHFTRFADFWKKYHFEKKTQKIHEFAGIYLFENGYTDFTRRTKNILLDGYFQSPRFFEASRDDIICAYRVDPKEYADYPGLQEIENRNAVCISIKVEHNVGSSIYDVCNDGYWKAAIDYIVKNVENPLFFICSDNVEYVKSNLIDVTKYDVVCQSRDYPVYESLAVMSLCKHFIIGNTTFGWWAQYLSEHPDKIVVAPSRWMKVDMPIDVYQDNWHLIDV